MNEETSAHPEEPHKSQNTNWLRASVLGVNDGVVSTASLMLGVAGAAASDATILTAGIAGLTAGACSMAIGEYVSVSSQKDSENADIAMERKSLQENPEAEFEELVVIYKERGLSDELAHQVAQELHKNGAIAAHMRDELGISDERRARPSQAAFASAVSFSVGAIFPVAAAVFASGVFSTVLIIGLSLAVLALSGAVGAYLGGGNKLWAAGRVFVGGALAMIVTFGIGYLVGQQV